MNKLPFLQKNLEALANAKSPVAFWLAHQRPDVDHVHDRIFENHWKLLDYRLPNGKGVFDAMPPYAFYKGWEGEQEYANSSVTFIIGVNVGYGLNHVLAKTPNFHKVVVIEPNPDMLLACLGQTDYTDYFKIDKLRFLPPDQEMIKRTIQHADVQFLFGRIYLRSDVPSQQLSPVYAELNKFCQATLENFSVEVATLRARQDIMVGNELDNYKRAMQDGSTRPLEGQAKGVTAVILGAGPTLPRFLPQIKEDRGDALYVSALQTLPALQKLDFKPNVAMVLDYSEDMTLVFDNLDPEWAKDIPLIYSTKVNHKVLEKYPGPTLPFWTMGGIATYVLNQQEHILDAGGNVSVALMRFLSWLQVERILLVGQDFAWMGQTHVDGHLANKEDYKINKVIELKNKLGETIYSSLPYITAIRDMERDIAEGDFKTYHLYYRGAVIQGAIHVDMDDVHNEQLLHSKPGSVKRFKAAMTRAMTPRPLPKFTTRSAEWAGVFRNVNKKLDKLFKKPNKNKYDIWETFQKLHQFLRSDPLYLPYIYNQLMTLSGWLQGGQTYTPDTHVKLKKGLKLILQKVRRVDNALSDAKEISRRKRRGKTQKAA